MRPMIGSLRRPAPWLSAVLSVAAIAAATAGTAAATVAPDEPPAPPEPVFVPVDTLLATIDGVLAEHPELADDGAAELAACPIVDLDGLNAVLADAATGWPPADALLARAGHDDADGDDGATIDIIRCDAPLSDDANIAILLAAVPPGYDDFSVDDDAEQTVTPPSVGTFGGELLASCEVDEDEPGATCGDVWLAGGLAIAVRVVDRAEPVDPAVVRSVLLGLVGVIAQNGPVEGDTSATGDSTAPAGSDAAPADSVSGDGVAIPGGVQPEILLEGTWFDDEGRLYMPEATNQDAEKDAAFCDFLFGTPEEIAAVFGVEDLTLFEGSGIFNNGSAGTGWRCGYTAADGDGDGATTPGAATTGSIATGSSADESGESGESGEPELIFMLSSAPFEIDEDPDGIAEYFVVDGGETGQSALLAISDEFGGDVIDADLAEAWLTTASSRTAR